MRCYQRRHRYRSSLDYQGSVQHTWMLAHKDHSSATMGKPLVPARFKSGYVDPAAASSRRRLDTALANNECILVVLQATYAGVGFTAMQKMNLLSERHQMSKPTFSNLQKQIGAAIKELCEKKCKEYRASLLENKESYALVFGHGMVTPWLHSVLGLLPNRKRSGQGSQAVGVHCGCRSRGTMNTRHISLASCFYSVRV